MENVIPVLSLIVAALAVFVGPLISVRVAKHQVRSSLAVASRQITDPMRQAWINTLRDLLSELCSSAHHYFVTGIEDRQDEEYRRLTYLETKIQLMLNAKEDDHIQLQETMRELIASLESGKDGESAFAAAESKIIDLSRQVLKREWNRVKEPITEA